MKHRITKIKVKKGVYTFGWETWQESTQSYDAYTLICEDVPREELKLCLQALAFFVVEICELHPDDEKTKYLTITALKELYTSKSPLILNTPARPNADKESDFCMSKGLMRALENLEEEAWRYINGDRAQQNLFEKEDVA
jgi:hypothetical protein